MKKGNTHRIAALFIRLTLTAASLLTLLSCEEQVDWELDMQEKLRLVVEGKITNEQKAHYVKLSLPVYEINGTPEPVSGAEVYIADGDLVYELEEDSLVPGTYLTAPDVRGEVGHVYYLFIRVQDYEFVAIAQMDPVTSVNKMAWYRVSADPELYRLTFYGTDTPSKYTVELDWSEVEGYEDLPDGETHALVYGYYFSPLKVDANALFSSGLDELYFPPGTKIYGTKESLSEGYAEYLRGMLSETTWNGGLFDVKKGDPFSNISEGGIGYFAASAVLRDSVVVGE